MTSYAPSSARPDLLLVINAAEDRLQLVAGSAPEAAGPDGPAIEAWQEWRTRGKILDCLAPALERMLDLLGGAKRLAGVACVRGPGSFSGLRIALATAAGFLAGARVPLAGLDYLPLLARAAVGQAPVLPGGVLAVVTHARRGLVHVQCFDPRTAAPLCPLRTVAAADVAAQFEAMAGPVHALGSGLRRNAEVLLSPGSPLAPLAARYDAPTPEALLAAAADAEFARRAVHPLYVRPSDAEENLAQLVALRGLTPEEGQEMLARARSRSDEIPPFLSEKFRSS